MPATPKTCSGGASRAQPQLAKRQPPSHQPLPDNSTGLRRGDKAPGRGGEGGVEQRASGHEAPVGWRGRDARGFPRAAANGSRGMGALSQ